MIQYEPGFVVLVLLTLAGSVYYARLVDENCDEENRAAYTMSFMQGIAEGVLRVLVIFGVLAVVWMAISYLRVT